MTEQEKLIQDIETMQKAIKLNGMNFYQWPIEEQRRILGHTQHLFSWLAELKERYQELQKSN